MQFEFNLRACLEIAGRVEQATGLLRRANSPPLEIGHFTRLNFTANFTANCLNLL